MEPPGKSGRYKSKTKKPAAKPKTVKKRKSESGPTCSMFLAELTRKLVHRRKEVEEEAPTNVVQTIIESLTNALPVVFSIKSLEKKDSPVKIENLQALAPELMPNDTLNIISAPEYSDVTMVEEKQSPKSGYRMPKMPVITSDIMKHEKKRVPVTMQDAAVNTGGDRDVASEISKHVNTLRKISLIAEEFNQKTVQSNDNKILDEVLTQLYTLNNNTEETIVIEQRPIKRNSIPKFYKYKIQRKGVHISEGNHKFDTEKSSNESDKFQRLYQHLIKPHCNNPGCVRCTARKYIRRLLNLRDTMDQTIDSDAKQPFNPMSSTKEYIIAFGNKIVLDKDNPNKQLSPERNSQQIDRRKNVTRKIPRLVRMPTPNSNRGDSGAGTSRMPMSRNDDTRYETDKTKNSHIPRSSSSYRRRSPPNDSSSVYDSKTKPADHSKDFSRETSPTLRRFSIPSKNVHRVQLVNISTDFAHDGEQATPASLAAAKPVPTLGHIFQRNNLQNERLNDWLMESIDEYLNPANSVASDMKTRRGSGGNHDTASNFAVVENQSTVRDSMETPATAADVSSPDPFPSSAVQSTSQSRPMSLIETANQNVNCLCSEIEYPTKENESGYRSMSPTGTANKIKSKQSDHGDAATPVGKQSRDTYDTSFSTRRSSEKSVLYKESEKASSAGSQLSKKPTVVISMQKPDGDTLDVRELDNRCVRTRCQEFKETITQHNSSTRMRFADFDETQKQDLSKSFQYPSHVEAGCQDSENATVNVPSYVEYPSEMIQRTTNFEVDGYVSPHVTESLAGTDMEIRDAYSQYTLEQMDDDVYIEDQLDCDHKSKSTLTNQAPTEVTENCDSPFKYHRGHDCKQYSHANKDTGNYRQRHHWIKELNGRMYAKHYCGDSWTRNHAFGGRYKRTFWGNCSMSNNWPPLCKIRRICRRRWDHVWHKTTHRLTHWPKSASRLKRIRLLLYLQRSFVWEDADAQTTMHFFRETGTGSGMRDQRSAAINTSLRLNSFFSIYNKSSGAVSKNSELKWKYSGPSMFPLFPHSRVASLRPVMKNPTVDVPRPNSCPGQSKPYGVLGQKSEKVTSKENNACTTDDHCQFGIVMQSFPYITDVAVGSSGVYGNLMINNDTSTAGRSLPLDDKIISAMMHLSCAPPMDAYTEMVSNNNAATGVANNDPFVTLTSSFDMNTNVYRLNIANPVTSRGSETKYLNGLVDVARSSNVTKESCQSEPLESQVPMIPLAINMTSGQSTLGQRFQDKISIFPRNGPSGTLNFSKKDCAVETDPINRHFSYTGVNVMSISSAEITKLPASTAMSNQMLNNTAKSATTSRSAAVCDETTSTTELTYLLDLIDRDFSDVDFIEKDETLDDFHVDIPCNPLITETSTAPFGADERSASASTSTDNTIQSACTIEHKLELSSKHASCNRLSTFKSVGQMTSEAPGPSKVKPIIENRTGSPTIMIDSQVQYNENDEINPVSATTRVTTGASLRAQSAKTSKNLVLGFSEPKPKTTDIGIQYSEFQGINELNRTHVNAAASAHLRLQSTATSVILVRSAERKSVDACIQYTGFQNITESCAERCASTGTCTCTAARVSTGLSPITTPLASSSRTKFDVCQCQESNASGRECTSIGINVNLGRDLSISFGQITSELRQKSTEKICKVDTEVQCVHHELNVQRSARIGHSRLMSVFTLNSSVIEASTQSDPATAVPGGAGWRTGFTSSVPVPALLYKSAAPHSTSLQTPLQPDSACTLPHHPLNSHYTYTLDRDTAPSPSLDTKPGSILDGGPVLLCCCDHIDESEAETLTDPNCLSVLRFNCPTCEFVRRTLNPKALSSHTTPRNNLVLQPPKSRSDNRHTEDRLVNLWRLISQKKSPTANPAEQMPDAVLSSKLNAAKWIKRCTFPVDKEFQSLHDLEQVTSEFLNRADTEEADADVSDPSSSKAPQYEQKKSSKAFHIMPADPSKPKLTNSAIPEPLLTVSKDSLADVLPSQETTKDRKVLMVDNITSDGALFSKDVRELELQASPDICDAATDSSMTAVRQQKSASAVTSRCVLSTARCIYDNTENCSNCLFVYDRPRCIVHKSKTDAGVQIYPSYHDVESEACKLEHLVDEAAGSTSGLVTACCSALPWNQGGASEVLSPTVYKAHYDTTNYVTKMDTKSYSIKSNFTNSLLGETENDPAIFSPQKLSAAILTSQRSYDGYRCFCKFPCGENAACTRTHTPEKQSASVLTSRCDFDCSTQCSYVRDMATGQDSEILRQLPCSNMLDGGTQVCSSCRARVVETLETPRCRLHHLDSGGSVEECVTSHLVGSCRYYRKLLTEQIGRVTNNFTKHTPTDPDQWDLFPKEHCQEACTMKPSGRDTLACQTHPRPRLPRPVSCCFLSPAMSLTDICRGKEQDLKSVYYMLTAIEGRMRRLKGNLPK